MNAIKSAMTPEEVKAVRWVEHVLAPILVFTIIAIGTFLIQVKSSVAQLQVDKQTTAETTKEIKEALISLTAKTESILDNQHKITVQTSAMQVNQQRNKEEINELKAQSAEILRILRDR